MLLKREDNHGSAYTDQGDDAACKGKDPKAIITTNDVFADNDNRVLILLRHPKHSVDGSRSISLEGFSHVSWR